MEARRLVITGRVHGVGFRAFVHEHATRIGLDGFVRNRKDGTVEALICGSLKQLEELIALCHKGPAISKVESVQVSEAKGIVDKGFKHLPTV